MITAAVWSFLLAVTPCVSAYAVRNEQFSDTRRLTSGCGTNASRVAQGLAPMMRRRSDIAYQSRQAVNSSALIPIDVYMQVLSADATEEGGNLSDDIIAAQMKILDASFEPVGFKFNLVETIRTINEYWYYNLIVASDVEDEVALTLRKGGNATLNIFMMGGLDPYTHGWSSVPRDLLGRAPYDGIFQNGTSFLGGSNPDYSAGLTLVHEVGHWFGLYHPFGNGCEYSYDYVSDTPVEDQPLSSGGCSVGRDSCPDQPGLDSVRNYMSYSDDSCRSEWTPGQIQRMREQMAKYRDVVYPGIDVDAIPEDDCCSGS